MIFILDNHREYSDHAIIFVDVPPALERELRTELDWTSARSEDAYSFPTPWSIIAEAEALTWRSGGSIQDGVGFLAQLKDDRADAEIGAAAD